MQQSYFKILVFSLFLILSVTHPYAGGWNDGSRLATAESIVDFHTLAINQSSFVNVPQTGDYLPYPANRPDLLSDGTKDKLMVRGFFYSDKTPLPSVYLASVYQIYRFLGGPKASDRPDWFCRILTWASSGVAFILFILATLKLTESIQGKPNHYLAAIFGFCTIVPGYVGTVNGHIIQLSAVTWLFYYLHQYSNRQFTRVRHLAMIGTLLGICYAAESSAGPTLFLCTVVGLFFITYKPMVVAIVFAAASPWLIAHHAINYSIGGTFAPANSNPEFFEWEGSPFALGNITGRWRHHTLIDFVRYSGDLLFGKQGFLLHNLPTIIAVLGFWPLYKSQWRRSDRIILLIGFCWCISTFLLAAASSTNRSGQCLSVRWFLPCLALAVFVLAQYRHYQPELLTLSIWGGVIGIFSAYYGAWIMHMIPGYWFIVAGAAASLMIMKLIQFFDIQVKQNIKADQREQFQKMAVAWLLKKVLSAKRR